MARWRRGEAEVEQLVSRKELELVTGSQADGDRAAGPSPQDRNDGCGTCGKRFPQCLRAGLRRSSFCLQRSPSAARLARHYQRCGICQPERGTVAGVLLSGGLFLLGLSSGGLIHEPAGRSGGAGGLRTKRSGWAR